MFFPQTLPSITAPPAITPDWVQTVAPTGLAIDLDTIKNFLNIPIEDSFFDAEKTAMTYVAQRAIEQYCQLTLMGATWVGNLPAFYDYIRIQQRPFCAVTGIQYVDPDTGIVTAVDPTIYVAGKTKQFCGFVALGDGLNWPAAAYRPDGVRITVTTGWTQTSLPLDIQQALLMTIAAVDHARADEGSGGGGGRQSIFAMKHPAAMGAPSLIPMTAKALLAPYKLMTTTVG
jgi:hypothetical protein